MKKYIITTCLLFIATACLGAAQQENQASSNGAVQQPAANDSAAIMAAEPEQAPAAAETRPADIDSLWDQANTAYINADYRRAIELYHAIENQDLASAKLYYNTGNAYFRDGKIGQAILYYNKALNLAPGDPDIRYNLDVANSYTKDHIQSVPEFFAHKWVRSVRQTLSGNAWGILSVIFLAVMLFSTMVYLLVRIPLFRKIGFFTAIAALFLFIVSTSFAVVERRHYISPSDAIVMNAAVSVKASPDKTGTDLFVLHEGTKVSVGNRMDSWVEITISDGKKGWIESKAIAMID